MTVYVLWRRGNCATRTVGAFLLPRWLVPKGGCVWRLLRYMTPDSWMQTSLYFTVTCTGSGCSWCAQLSRCRGRPIPFHHLTVHTDPDEGVLAIVDEVFDKREAYVLVELPRMTQQSALAFFYEMTHTKRAYNAEGATYNFLPWPMRREVGLDLGDKLSNAKALFCSEMITAWLQKDPDYGSYLTHLVPCRTTPQMLYDALLTGPSEMLPQRIFDQATGRIVSPIVSKV